MAIMYATPQQFAPGMDVGIDLTREYEAARQLRQQKSDVDYLRP